MCLAPISPDSEKPPDTKSTFLIPLAVQLSRNSIESSAETIETAKYMLLESSWMFFNTFNPRISPL
ncbi:MAG: hypothetical protein SWO11_07910 [Thermodesulfobacteriota bacterium]|nr:hypothetical protein [Thermodesulfobacteriota bacterium]